jgi:hypothetical protein
MTSVLGQLTINILFILIGVMLLFSQAFFLCNEFSGLQVDMREWWTLADNYETSTTSMIVMFQIVNAAAVFNIGSVFRAGWFRNRAFLFFYAGFFGMVAFMLLADPNPLGCAFRIKYISSFLIS